MERHLPLTLAFSALAMLVLAVPAFWPPYLSRFGAAEGYTHFHAALGTAWLVLLVVQPVLLRAGRRAAHRALGRAGLVVGLAFVVSGVLTAHRAVVRMSAEQFAREGHTLYLPLVMTVIFGAALAGGAWWRSVPAAHGRFMACTALPLLDPLVARILYFHFPPLPAEFLYQVPAFTLMAAVLVLLARSMPRAGALRPAFTAFAYFAAGTVVALLLHFATAYSAGWLAFVAWFRSLPLT